jgi:hypothetical protein
VVRYGRVMSISDDDINAQPVEDGLPPVVVVAVDENDDGGSDSSDVDDADSGD